MKRIVCIILGLVIAFSCVACGDSSVDPTAPVTFPEEKTTEEVTVENNTTPEDFMAFGIKFGKLTAEELAEIIPELIEKYEIKITLDGYGFSVTGANLGLVLADDIDYSKLISGEMTAKDLEAQVSISEEEALKQAVLNSYYTYLQYLLDTDSARKEAEKNGGQIQPDTTEGEEIVLTDDQIEEIKAILADPNDTVGAHIVYSKDAKAFVGVDGETGEYKDFSKSLEGLKTAILNLEEEYTITYETVKTEGEKAEGNAKIEKAIIEANKYLDIKITYNFSSPGGSVGHTILSGSKIANYIYVGEDGITIKINEDEITSLSNSLVEKYSNITTNRTTENDKIVITRKGWTTDANTVFSNIKKAIEEKKTVDYNAEFYEVDETVTENLSKSTYVYVDLTAQTVYLFENNVCIYSTPCVSGKVAPDEENGKQHYTGRGTFEIYSKERNRYLTGANYRSFVKYWMPFNGGQGLHDASWRDEFGGDIYYWSGSHGCVNLPEEAAAFIWDHVKVGTKVIVTGGLRTAPSSGQKITCDSVYNRSIEDGPFNLGATCLGGANMTYTSNNTSVITVDNKGNVTPVGAGSATVTITTQLTTQYWGKTVVVTVNIAGKKQNISVNSESYQLYLSDSSFNLGASCSTSALTYNSNNSSVVTVDKEGNVSIIGVGETTIIISAKMNGVYAQTTKSVKIKVSAEQPSSEEPTSEIPTTEPVSEPTTEEPTEPTCEVPTTEESSTGATDPA